MKILIVVDYQNDFVNGALGFEGAEKIDEKIADTIEDAYSKGYEIIVTKDTHYDNYLDTQEGKKLPIKHCIKNDYGWDIYGKTAEILKNKNIKFINKETFGSLELIDHLKSLGIEKIEDIYICGVVTNMCVISNAVIAKSTCTEAEINIIEPLCLSFDNEMHKKAIDVMKSMQMNIVENM